MTERSTSTGSSTTTAPGSPVSRSHRAPSLPDPLVGPRAELARMIPRRKQVRWWLGVVFALGFAAFAMPTVTAERWLGLYERVERDHPAPITVRVPPLAGFQGRDGVRVDAGGVLIAAGDAPTTVAEVANIRAVLDAQPRGPVPYIAYGLLAFVLAWLYSHHTRRSTYGRLVRVQLTNLALVGAVAVAVKVAMLETPASVVAVPVALFALVPTIVLDRVVGLATGTLAALVVSLLVPFDVGVAILLLVQAGVAGLVVAERPKARGRAVLVAGAAATLLAGLTYPLLVYLTTGQLPTGELRDPAHSMWIATMIGPAIATALAVAVVPLYQLLVGEITRGKLVELEDLSHPLLKQIAERAPGTWQHSLAMANMAEIAANAIGANGRLVRVGAYFHDLGKSLSPKYFIENLEPGETSPHDHVPPETSCDAIFSHVTEGIVTARRAGLHDRIVDFMHMHHGNGVLEYFWAKCREQGNPRELSVEHFRYPGVPPQSRETAILAVCDAVEAAARTLKKPDSASIDSLVQRIVYGKLHLGQLDESGLSMGDLRRVADSLRETIRHANHGRIEYPWQKAEQDASASFVRVQLTDTSPRLDSLDRPARPETVRPPPPAVVSPTADTANVGFADTRPTPPSTTAPQATAPPAARAGSASAPPLLAAAEATSPGRVPKPPATTLTGVPQGPLPAVVAVPGGDSIERRPTPPHGVPTDPVRASAQFVADAQAALADAHKRNIPKTTQEVGPPDIVSSQADPSSPERVARARAATLPPIARRAPTAPPPVAVPPGQTTLPGGGRPRPPAQIVDDDPPAEPPPPLASEDAATTQPRGFAAASDTQPRIELPLPAPVMSDPMIAIPDEPAPPPAPKPKSKRTYPTSLAARIDAAMAGSDDEFGADTPVSAPTRAELRALTNQPPDPTRQQSIEEIERLHRAARDPDGTRRAPATTEVDPDDIVAAIELAPPAKRSGPIAVAKTKKTE